MPVDFGFAANFRLNLDVDAGEPFVEFNEVGGGVEVAQLANNFVTREARKKPRRRGLVSEIAEHD